MVQQQWMRVCVLAIAVVCLTVTSVSAETLTLDQCIDIALSTGGSSSYQLPGARQQFHSAQQGVWSSWGNVLPSLSHGYSYRQSRQGEIRWSSERNAFINLEEEGYPQISTNWTTGFTLSHTLFDGGANIYGIARAYHSRRSARDGLRSAENQLILGVKEKYFGLLKARKLVEVQEAAVRRADEFLKTIESRYDLGSASLSEVLKARVQRGTEDLELLRRQNDLKTTRADLNSVLNRPVDSDLDIADIGSSEEFVPSYEGAIEAALEESPDVLSARSGVSIARDDMGIARATLFPTFSWQISRSFAPRERNDLLDFDGRFAEWGIGANLSFSIFNGFHRKTAISAARVGVKTSRQVLDQTETQVRLAVKQAYLGVELADQTRNLAGQIEGSAQQDFNLAQEKYNLGAATILDLLDAQASLTKAQNDRVNAESDYHTAVARLQNAMGGGR